MPEDRQPYAADRPIDSRALDPKVLRMLKPLLVAILKGILNAIEQWEP